VIKCSRCVQNIEPQQTGEPGLVGRCPECGMEITDLDVWMSSNSGGQPPPKQGPKLAVQLDLGEMFRAGVARSLGIEKWPEDSPALTLDELKASKSPKEWIDEG